MNDDDGGPAPVLGEEFERWSAALAAARPDPGGGAAGAVALGLAAALTAMVARCTTPGRGASPRDEAVAAGVLVRAEAVRGVTAGLAADDAEASRAYVEALRATVPPAGGAPDRPSGGSPGRPAPDASADGARALETATRAAAASALRLGLLGAELVADLELLEGHAPALLRADVAVAALLLAAAVRSAAVTAGAGADATGTGRAGALEGAARRADAVAAACGGLGGPQRPAGTAAVTSDPGTSTPATSHQRRSRA